METTIARAPDPPRVCSLAAAALLASLALPALADDPRLVSESYLIPSADRGVQLYIRNKHPAGVTSFPAEKILLYVHGATYPPNGTPTCRAIRRAATSPS
jgi:hypothetical protein